MNLLVLGSGTSSGVPTIGCSCAVCHSSDPRDNRMRPSVLIEYQGRNLVIDTTPDFRTQVLREGVSRLDAIVFTHSHADHILGFDDIRPYNLIGKARIPVYGSAETIDSLKRIFPYVFAAKTHKTFVPEIEVFDHLGLPFDAIGLRIQPVPLIHGSQTIHGYRIGNLAYLTDHSEIPEASFDLLHDLDVLFLDALRYRPHPTHSTVQTALENIDRIRPRSAFFTHICHDLPHAATEATLPPHIRLAFDGLRIPIGDAS